MENFDFLAHFGGRRLPRADLPPGGEEHFVDELEPGFLFAEVESVGGLLSMNEDGGLFRLGFPGRFGEGACLLQIGQQLCHQDLLFGNLLKCGFLLPLQGAFRDVRRWESLPRR